MRSNGCYNEPVAQQLMRILQSPGSIKCRKTISNYVLTFFLTSHHPTWKFTRQCESDGIRNYFKHDIPHTLIDKQLFSLSAHLKWSGWLWIREPSSNGSFAWGRWFLPTQSSDYQTKTFWRGPSDWLRGIVPLRFSSSSAWINSYSLGPSRLGDWRVIPNIGHRLLKRGNTFHVLLSSIADPNFCYP